MHFDANAWTETNHNFSFDPNRINASSIPGTRMTTADRVKIAGAKPGTIVLTPITRNGVVIGYVASVVGAPNSLGGAGTNTARGGGIKVVGSEYSQSYRSSCAPVTLWKISDAMSGAYASEYLMMTRVSMAQNSSMQDWNMSGTALYTWNDDGTLNTRVYEDTMTSVLASVGVSSVVSRNEGYLGTPSAGGMAMAIMGAAGPAAISVSFEDRNGLITNHSVAAEYRQGVIVLTNPLATGGTASVPLEVFTSGAFSVGGTTMTLEPGFPTIVPVRK